MEKLVSIIIPIYKVEKYLERCLISILNQSYKNLDVILVDDGSPDNCGVICDEYAKQDNRITVIHKKNGGVSDARNKGIDIAKGQYITFVDPDDFIHYKYVKTMVDAAEKFGCEVVQCEFEKGESDKFSILDEQSRFEIFDNVNIFYGRKLKITPWAKLYIRSIFSSLRFPSGKINEDEFVTYKAIYGASRIVLINTPLYYYYQSPVSIMRGKNKEIKLDFIPAFEERIDYFQDKNECELAALSKKEFAIRAMLYYMKYHPTSVDIEKQLIVIFKDNIKGILRSRRVSLYEKLVLTIFNMSPNISSFIARKFLLK